MRWCDRNISLASRAPDISRNRDDLYPRIFSLRTSGSQLECGLECGVIMSEQMGDRADFQSHDR